MKVKQETSKEGVKKKKDLYFDDFIEEDLRILLKLKLEVLRRRRRRRNVSVLQ